MDFLFRQCCAPLRFSRSTHVPWPLTALNSSQPDASRILYGPANDELYWVDVDRERKQVPEECTPNGITLRDNATIIVDDVHAIWATPQTTFLLDGVAGKLGAHLAELWISDFDGGITHRSSTKRFTTYELPLAPRQGVSVHRGRARRRRASSPRCFVGHSHLVNRSKQAEHERPKEHSIATEKDTPMTISIRKFPTAPVVNYTQFRPQIASGDLLLCSGSGIFSRMIRAGTKSVWSHVGFVMRLDAIDRIMVLESVEPLGIRTVPLSKYLTDYDSKGNPYPGRLAIARHDDFNAKASSRRLLKFGQFAVDLFGYPYDQDEIAKIAARIAASYLPFSAADKRALKRDREYICSEYVWECYKSLGIRINHDKRGFISPADFAKAKEVKLQAVLQ